MKITALVLSLLLAATAAYAQFNGCPPGFCPVQGGGGGGGGGGSNFILMIDNSSRILQTDNTSKICKAGGC